MSVTSHVTALVDRRDRVGITRRLVRLFVGLAGFGVSLAILVKARLGLDPWDVLNQGIARQIGIPIGWVVDAVGAVVLVAWIPLRQRPGPGTIANIVVVGLVMNVGLVLIPAPRDLLLRAGVLATSIVLNGLASACYIGAGLGPGPRDGLMTGLAAKGHSIRVVRTAIELGLLTVGIVLGGTVGIGTVAYALSIGPMIHIILPRLSLDPHAPESQSIRRRASWQP